MDKFDKALTNTKFPKIDGDPFKAISLEDCTSEKWAAFLDSLLPGEGRSQPYSSVLETTKRILVEKSEGQEKGNSDDTHDTKRRFERNFRERVSNMNNDERVSFSERVQIAKDRSQSSNEIIMKKPFDMAVRSFDQLMEDPSLAPKEVLDTMEKVLNEGEDSPTNQSSSSKS